LEKAIEQIRISIEEEGGILNVKMKVCLFTTNYPSHHVRCWSTLCLSRAALSRALLLSFLLSPLAPKHPRLTISSHPCFQPKAVSESEDLELAAMMARAQQENAEVSGDEAEDDSDAGAE
jgi:hypothetical protein